MRIKLKDISRHSIKAVDSTDYPRLDDEVFDIMIGSQKVLLGVSGRDMGLSDLFCDYFQLEEDDCPTAKEMAEFRVGKVIELLNEAKRLADEFDVNVEIDLVFSDDRQHPHLKHIAVGDVIVNTFTVATGPPKYGGVPMPSGKDFPKFDKYKGDDDG